VSRGRLVTVVLLVVAVVAVAVGAWLLVRGPQISPGADTAARQDVRAATERFATAINSYDVTDLDPYVERVTPLLTDDLAEQFELSTQDLLARFEQTKIVSVGKVEQVAIDSIDGDSAEALAAITVTTKPENVQYGQPRLRWRVSLVREGDTWLVDNFANVAVEPAPAAEEEGQ
jgi:Mce-associated membrane protein